MLPLYAEGPPHQNSPFDRSGGSINYPYSLREKLTDKSTERSLRAIYLENRYLKCSVLPNLGGHLSTCERSPHPDLLPQSLGYELAFTKRGAHESASAEAIFRDRSFSRSAEKSSAPNKVYWAVQAAKQASDYTPKNWHNRLLQALTLSENRIYSADASYRTHVSALLAGQLGNAAAAESNVPKIRFRVLTPHRQILIG